MHSPRYQWATMCDITNKCSLSCSNCTRLLLHTTKETGYFMSPECFRKVIRSIKDFVYSSPPDRGEKHSRKKVIGLIGGEPLLHKDFPEIVSIFCEEVPEVTHRGLWTSKDIFNGSHPAWGAYLPQVEKLIGKVRGTGGWQPGGGYLNWNMHTAAAPSRHQPLLMASRDVVKDRKRRWQLIEDCWVQKLWSSTSTDKGFFFCEVAAHFDRIFNLGVGLPSEPGVWNYDLDFVTDEDGVRQPTGMYANQIKAACERCGGCVPLPNRLDHEEKDDVSTSNYVDLVQLGSKALKRDQVVHHEEGSFEWKEDEHAKDWKPFKYLGDAKPDLIQVCKDRAKEKAAKAAEKKAE